MHREAAGREQFGMVANLPRHAFDVGREPRVALPQYPGHCRERLLLAGSPKVLVDSSLCIHGHSARASISGAQSVGLDRVQHSCRGAARTQEQKGRGVFTFSGACTRIASRCSLSRV